MWPLLALSGEHVLHVKFVRCQGNPNRDRIGRSKLKVCSPPDPTGLIKANTWENISNFCILMIFGKFSFSEKRGFPINCYCLISDYRVLSAILLLHLRVIATKPYFWKSMMRGSKRMAMSEPNQAGTNETTVSVTCLCRFGAFSSIPIRFNFISLLQLRFSFPIFLRRVFSS